jgi:serine/threonine-protein kinase
MPEKIGRYQILERVGRGGMGVLYRGFDPVLDREVAVKVMLTDFSDDHEQMRPRFYREAKAAAKLQHRNIVTVFEFAEEANQPHIVMEFLKGVSLGARMTAAPPLTLEDKLDIVAQLCTGLGYAHSQGVVHRDVKPANVFILEDGTVKLLDFGIAKLTTSTLTRQGDVLGSASYMAPEQVAGSDSVDGRADVWSAGVVLFEMLAGRKPFEGESPTNVIVKILKDQPPAIDQIVPGLPKQLVAAVNRALEKDPARRITKAEELGRELQWIRKALQASSDLAPMEDTRYASTQVLKALHNDLQKSPTGTISARTMTGMSGAAAAPARSKSWLVPAAIAAAVLVAAGAGWTFFGRSDSTNTAATAPALGGPPSASGAGGPNATALASGVSPATTTAPGAPAPPVAVPDAQRAPAIARAAETTARGADAPPSSNAASRPGATAAKPAAAPSKPAAAQPGDDSPPADTRKTAPPPSVPAVMVDVSMTGAYPFEVFDGSRSISAASRSHELPPQPNGKTLRVVAPSVFLDHPVKVDGGSDRRFTYTAPQLGRLDIRVVRGDCKTLVGNREIEGPPFLVTAVEGDYDVSLSCPDGLNPTYKRTVTRGRTARVDFLNK